MALSPCLGWTVEKGGELNRSNPDKTALIHDCLYFFCVRFSFSMPHTRTWSANFQALPRRCHPFRLSLLPKCHDSKKSALPEFGHESHTHDANALTTWPQVNSLTSTALIFDFQLSDCPCRPDMDAIRWFTRLVKGTIPQIAVESGIQFYFTITTSTLRWEITDFLSKSNTSCVPCQKHFVGCWIFGNSWYQLENPFIHDYLSRTFIETPPLVIGSCLVKSSSTLW